MLVSILAIENDDQRNRMINIYENYAPFVYKCIAVYRIEEPGRKDAFQDVFQRLIEHIEVLMVLESSPLRSYIWYTVRSVCCSHLKKEHRYQIESLDQLMQQDHFDLVDLDTPPAYENLEKEEMSAKVREVMEELSPWEQDILHYKYFLGMSNEEIAKSLGIAANSVRVYLMRAKRHLLALWKGCAFYNE